MKKALITTMLVAMFVVSFRVESLAVVQNCFGLFPDVGAQNTLCPYIEYLYKQGVVSGYSDQKFHSDDLVTRAQFAKMVVNAFQLGVGAGDGSFPDVPSSNKFYHEINTLKSFGIITGYSDGTFRPDEKVTRGAAMKFTVNAAKITNSSLFPTVDASNISSTFKDVTSAHTFAQFIANAYGVNDPSLQEKLIGGFSDGTFRPDQYMTRAQVAKVLANSMKYAKTETISCTMYFCQDYGLSIADGRLTGQYFDVNYDKSFWTVESDSLLGSVEEGDTTGGQYGYIATSSTGQSVVLFMAMDMSNPSDPNAKYGRFI
jgi:hypothetical protein